MSSRTSSSTKHSTSPDDAARVFIAVGMTSDVALSVSISVSGLPVRASRLSEAIRAATEAQGGRNIAISVSDDETELHLSFVLHAVDDDEAYRRGYAVLDALDADEFAFSVGVFRALAT